MRAARAVVVRLRVDGLEDRVVPAAPVDLTLATLARLDTAGGDGLRTGPLAKAGYDLALLYREYTAAGPFAPSNTLLQVSAGSVAVEAVPAGDPAILRAALAGIGFRASAAASALVSGWLPITAIPAAAQLTTLTSLRPSYRLVANAGSVTSQGDAAERSDDVRKFLGLDGTGVKVGVISDSFNALGGATGDVSTGDLPGPGNPEGRTTPVNVLADAGGTDEGRAMLQIVHDVAPGADLQFHTAGASQADLAAAIRALANAGADVIVDDVTFPAEPMFQDGVAAQAVDQAAAAGVSYFSAAGNLGRQSYESGFRNSGVNLGSSGSGLVYTSANFYAHDFDPGTGTDLFQTVTLGPGVTTFSFQWSDRYASAGGGGAAADLDLAVFDMNGVFLSTLGGFTANVGGDPTEVFQIDAGGGGQYQLAIGKFSGAADPAIVKYVAFGTGFVADEYASDSGTVFGHANAAGAAAVGAARYTDSPAFGGSPAARPFTGRGGTPILFDTAGNPQTAAPRPNPRFVAPDGVNTTFFGQGDDEPDGRPNFTGTSAAAPHAAGVAALMLQANRGLSPFQVYDALAATALDIGPAGVDPDSGAGLIQATAAVLRVGGTFDVTFGGTAGPDAMLVRRNPSGTAVEFVQNGTVVFSLALSQLGRVTVDGGGGSDTLTLDYTFGAPLTSAGLGFTGGGSAGDQIVLTGYDVGQVVVTHEGPGNGTIQVGTTGQVDFAQTAPVVLDGAAAEVVVNLPEGTPNPGAAVGAAGTPGFAVVAGTTFASTRFRDPTARLAVDLGDAGDTLTAFALDAAFAAFVAVTGGAGVDAVIVAGGGADDAVRYTPAANELVLTAGGHDTRFVVTAVESLAADGSGQASGDAVTVVAPQTAIVFSPGGGTVSAGGGWLPLVYRNFERATLQGDEATVFGSAANDAFVVQPDGVVRVSPSDAAVYSVVVAAPAVLLDGLAGDDRFTVPADHPFSNGLRVNGNSPTGGGTVLSPSPVGDYLVVTGGPVAFDPASATIRRAGFGAITYADVESLKLDTAGADVNGGGGPTTVSPDADGLILTLPDGSRVRVTDGPVTVTGGAGTADTLVVFAPDGATIANGVVETGTGVRVVAGAGIDRVEVVGGAGDDTFTVTPGGLPVAVTGLGQVSGDRLVILGPVSGRPDPAGGVFNTNPPVSYQGIELFTLGSTPVAADDAVTTAEDTRVTIAVLGNDTGLGDGPVTVTIVAAPAAGTAVVVGTQVVYTPGTNAVGPVTFTYRVEDANGEASVATVTVTVAAVNDPPVALPVAVATTAGTPVAVVLAGDDGDPDVAQQLTYTVLTPPASGTLSGFDPRTGRVLYTPNPGFTGTDSFTFVVTDAPPAGSPPLTSAAGTVTIAVRPLNLAPTPRPDAYAPGGTRLVVAARDGVLANDSDPDGDPLAAALVTGPAFGVVSLAADGSFTYVAPPRFAGTDTFTYAAADGRGGVAAATVTIAVPVTGRRYIATGAGAGGGPHVKVFDAATGEEVFSFFAYDPMFRGGVRVAVGDVDGDGVPDIITTPGPGGGPHVKVFSGVDLTELASFYAFDPTFRTGANVAAGDVDGDGLAEVVVGAAAGGGPRVRTFDVAGGAAAQLAGPLGSFYAFDEAYSGGVSVAVGNYDGAPWDEIIVGTATTYPQVRVFAASGAITADFLAFDLANVGITVAAGDVDGDGKADVIVGPGDGGGPVVRTFRGGAGGQLISATTAFDATLRGGVAVAASDRNGDGRADVVVAPTEQARAVQVYDDAGRTLFDEFEAYASDFPGGVYVGAG